MGKEQEEDCLAIKKKIPLFKCRMYYIEYKQFTECTHCLLLAVHAVPPL